MRTEPVEIVHAFLARYHLQWNTNVKSSHIRDKLQLVRIYGHTKTHNK